MKKKNACVWVIGLLGLSMLVLLGIGAVLLVKAVPDVSTQLQALKPVILVDIPQPINGQILPLEEVTGVYVTVVSPRGLQSVQAYADGVPLELIMSSPLGESTFSVLFHWLPAVEGVHYITARVTNQEGLTVLSNPVQVEAIVPASPEVEPMLEESSMVFGVSTDSENFETEFDIEVERLLARAGDQAPTWLELPSLPSPAMETAPDFLPASIAGSPRQASFLQKLQLRTSTYLNRQIPLPFAPELSGVGEDCTIHLRINDTAANEVGMRLYRRGPYDSNWSLAADLQANPGTGIFGYEDPDRSPGRYIYYAASYNASGENPGGLFSTEVTAGNCSEHSPIGMSLQNTILTPTVPLDKLYCYSSMNGADWDRVPRDPGDFLFPVNGAFDLSPYMRATASLATPVDISLECWGWVEGSLVPLGRTSRSISAGLLELDTPNFHIRGDWKAEPVRPGNFNLKLLTFAPPYYLHYPNSLAACSVHTGGDASLKWACENLIDLWGKTTAGHAILVWHWSIYENCNAEQNYCGYSVPLSEVKGFHVYRQASGKEAVLIKTIHTNAVTMAVLTPGETTSASASTRYFVRAFMQDGFESGNSNLLEAVPAAFSMTIPAQSSGGVAVRVYKPSGKIVEVSVPPDAYNPVEPPEYGIDAGYMRHHSDHMDKVSSMYWDAYISFNLSQVPGTITSARLRWDGTISTVGPGNDLYADRCFNRLTTFHGDKVGYAPMILLTMDEDVTPYALAWQKAVTSDIPEYGFNPYNFGFWFLSGDRSLAYTDYFQDQCLVRLKNVRLEVEYLK